jgi:hypothetical protein
MGSASREARDFFYKERAKGGSQTYREARNPAQWNALLFLSRFIHFIPSPWKNG